MYRITCARARHGGSKMSNAEQASRFKCGKSSNYRVIISTPLTTTWNKLNAGIKDRMVNIICNFVSCDSLARSLQNPIFYSSLFAQVVYSLHFTLCSPRQFMVHCTRALLLLQVLNQLPFCSKTLANICSIQIHMQHSANNIQSAFGEARRCARSHRSDEFSGAPLPLELKEAILLKCTHISIL